jgi:hypothetical protein
MSTSVQQLVPTITSQFAYPELSARILQAVFPANIFVNTLTYYSIADTKVPAVTFVLQNIPTTDPTIQPIGESEDIPVDMTPYSNATVTPNFWGDSVRIPRTVTEDLMIPVMEDYLQRITYKTAYTRDKHVEQTLNTTLPSTAHANGTNNFIGFTGVGFDLQGVFSQLDIRTMKANVEKDPNNFLITDLIANAVNASDLIRIPNYVSAFYYGRTDIGVNGALQQATAPIGLLHGYNIWVSNVTTVGTVYALAAGGANVNNLYSPLGFFVEKRPPQADNIFWPSTDEFRVFITTRFKSYVARTQAGYAITGLNTS